MAHQSLQESPPALGVTPTPTAAEFDLGDPTLYLNRELTWLEFNRRVLHEAQDSRTPLLERLKFVAIASSNLDEFFMKRIGGLKQQLGAGLEKLTVDGRSPAQQIHECYAVIRELERQKQETLAGILGMLREHDIVLLSYAELDGAERAVLRQYYLRNIFPLVTPLAMDPAHPFPFISNLSLNLLVALHYPDESWSSLARVKVPVGSGIPRFLRVGEGLRFVPLEEVMASNLDLLFPEMVVDACEMFRVTRNAITERDEDQAEDLLVLIESELRDRDFAPIVRIEVRSGIDPSRRGMLAAELGLNQEVDVFEVDGMLGMRQLMELVCLEAPALHDEPHHPIDNIKLLESRNIFHIIRETGPILLQHPYESFSTSVERFLSEASRDLNVRAIKMTVYRTSSDSKIIQYLTDAARNGKQVAVAVELKARFDEAANIGWANQMEEVGIHVTYGVVGLKTHCKTILVVRQDYNGLRRYAHIGTGNYHAGTARLYTDLGLLTCDEAIGQDLTELFNYLTTGYTPARNYKRILPAPKVMKNALLGKIEREIGLHSEDSPGLIQFKMNALEDADITRALYLASQAGVTVHLLVRDTCRLRPGIPGLSEHIRVRSIVGRFLEHSRVYYFRNGGEEEYYIGSADCMTRNLESRVEVIAPVEESSLRAELRAVLDSQLEDNVGAWDMQADGSYLQAKPAASEPPRGSQQVLMKRAGQRSTEAHRLRKRKTRGLPAGRA